MAAPDAAVRHLQAGVAAHQAGDMAAAAEAYRAALAEAPEQPDALHLLGVIADQQGRHAEAVDLIGRAIAGSPQAAEFHGNLGTALLALGRDDEAAAAYRRAIELDPAYADGHANLGNLLRRRREAEAALASYAAALALQPDHAGARLGLGAALLMQKRPDEALPHLAAACRLDPLSAEARDLAATALRHAGREAEAVQQHRKALSLAPGDIRLRENFAVTLVKSERPDSWRDAERELSAIIAEVPNRIDSLIALGSVLIKLQRAAEALPYLQHARMLAPDRIEILVNLSVALAQAGEFAAALACCEQAARIAPDDCLVLSHRGTVREHAGDYDGALADYAAALAAPNRRDPQQLAEAGMKQALLLLSLGRLAEGWPRYSARVGAKHADRRGAQLNGLLPRWDGVVRPDQRLLVWGEQGIGDQVLYAGLLPDLAQRKATFTTLCDPRLLPLFRRSFPGLAFDSSALDNLGAAAAQADAQIGLGDLGVVLRPDLAAFPPPRAYLVPDPERVATFRARYRSHGRRHVVGITWRSSNLFSGNFKSIALAHWAPLLRRDDVLFVDLQYGDTAAERAALRAASGVEILHDDSVDAMTDLDGFTAQAAAMDLVIGGSNSGIHLAAAAGQVCWVLLPGGLGRLWYWFLARTDSPWYPQVRLFRQPVGRHDDWDGTLATLNEALAQRLRSGP